MSRPSEDAALEAAISMLGEAARCATMLPPNSGERLEQMAAWLSRDALPPKVKMRPINPATLKLVLEAHAQVAATIREAGRLAREGRYQSPPMDPLYVVIDHLRQEAAVLGHGVGQVRSDAMQLDSMQVTMRDAPLLEQAPLSRDSDGVPEAPKTSLHEQLIGDLDSLDHGELQDMQRSTMPVALRDAVTVQASASPLSEELHKKLSALDHRLIEKLRSGAIRLVRVEWLQSQPEGFQLPYRQQLEALEQRGASPTPLLSPQEAVELIQRGDRSVAAVTQYALVHAVRMHISRMHVPPA